MNLKSLPLVESPHGAAILTAIIAALTALLRLLDWF